jgi:XTP/dITP diphosphohydrolase
MRMRKSRQSASDPLIEDQVRALRQLVDLITALRTQCPWDREQTLLSLKNKLIEESYELIDAIEQDDPSSIQEEIGDVLFLALFFTRLYHDEKGVSPDALIAQTVKKYKKKHPHVFRDKKLPDKNAVLRYWHESKADIFSGIPKSLPALLSAKTIQERASKVGFDWETHHGPLEKVKEELRELEAGKDNRAMLEELGDLLFACVNFARHLNIDPEDALKAANSKFIRRFRKMQQELKKHGKNLTDASLDEMDAFWNEIKHQDGS